MSIFPWGRGAAKTAKPSAPTTTKATAKAPAKTVPVPVKGKTMTISDIQTVAANAGFVGFDLVTAVAIALAESGGNPDAHGDTTIGSGTGSFGLWQIYSDAHPEYGPDFSQLYDPQTNANAAYAIYQQANDSFSPWSTFKSGAYETFISDVQNVIQAATTTVEENPGTSAGILLAVVVLGLLWFFRKA